MQLPINLLNVSLFSSADMSSTQHSSSIEIREGIRLCFQASWTGSSPVGTLQVEGSNDNVIFSSDPEAAASNVSGNTGNVMIKIANTSYPYVRLTYNATSGTGSLNASVNAKRA